MGKAKNPSADVRTPARTELGGEGLVRVFDYQCRAARGAAVEAEQFSACAISVVRSGVFGFRSDDGARLLTTGAALLANPGQQYEISHEHAGGDRCVIFRFDEGAIEELVGSPPLRSARRYFARSVLPPSPRVNALRRIAEERLSTGADVLGLEEVGLRLAAVVGQALERAPRPEAPRDRRVDRDRVHAAIDAIERGFDAPIRLGALAKLAGASPYHFLRMFKQVTGHTPHQFVIQVRLQRAIERLRDTRTPVTDIALDVGFADLSNFISTFRREVGCSPSRFRREPRERLPVLVGGRASAAR